MKSSERKSVDDYAERLLKNMLEIYSPSGEEWELSKFLLGELEKLGFQSRIDDVGNVIAESGQDSPTVLLCGHMDTVPGNLETRLVGGKISGRGAVDAKSSLAAMIVGASKVRNEFPGRILLLAVVDEEGHGTGMKHFMRTNSLDIDYAVFGEPSNSDNIVIGYKGLMNVTLKCTTKAGHSAAPWLSENAIERAMETWNLMKGRFEDTVEGKSYFHGVTGALIRIEGGSSTNVIPSQCEITLDLRVPPDQSCKQVLNEFRRLIDSYLKSNRGVSMNLHATNQVEACLMNADSTLARSFSWAIRKVRRKNPTFLKKTGTSDMNLLSSAVKIPMIAYGPGDSRLDHTAEEEIEIEDYLAAIQIYESALKQLAALHIKNN